MKDSFKKKWVRSMLKWVGHVERIGDENLANRSDAQKVERKSRGGRPRMRCEDYVKRDLEKQQNFGV